MTTETESVNEILSAMKAASMQCADFATRIQAAHAREVGAKQAEIDRLMLEHCPDEMTQEQLETWGKSQRVVKSREDVLCVRCNKPTMHMGNVCYTCGHPPRVEVIR